MRRQIRLSCKAQNFIVGCMLWTEFWDSISLCSIVCCDSLLGLKGNTP